MRAPVWRTLFLAPVCGTLTFAAALPAQWDGSAPRDSNRVTLGSEYRIRHMAQLVLGDNYRQLWATPVKVGVLDLRTAEGGFQPIGRGTELDVETLFLRSGEGHEYSFRAVNWDPFAVLPSRVRQSLVQDFVKDQVSGAYPPAELVAVPLIDAVGVPRTPSTIIELPRDSILGDYLETFAGMVGVLRRIPLRGADLAPPRSDVREVVTTPELLLRLARCERERVDPVEYLNTRLLDVYIGDWLPMQRDDRWAKVGPADAERWILIPGPRRQAFARYDSPIVRFMPMRLPGVASFGNSYNPLPLMIWSARDLDRRFLPEVTKHQWDSVALAMQKRLTDSVIAAAVRQLPASYLALDSARLTKALHARRDNLVHEARHFYKVFMQIADIRATGLRDSVDIVRTPEPGVEVRLLGHESPDSTPQSCLHRRFSSKETREVRLYLGAGEDVAVVRGTGGDGTTVRVIAHPERDSVIVLSGGRHVKVYEDRGDSIAAIAAPDSIYFRLDSVVAQSAASHWRDWGSVWSFPPWLDLESEVGLFIGGGAEYTTYGFRKYPYASRYYARVGYSTGLNQPAAEVGAELHSEGTRGYIAPLVRWSGIDVRNFFGFGNETQRTQPEEFYEVNEHELTATVEFGIPFGRQSMVTLAPILKDGQTFGNSTLLTSAPIYGTGPFGQIGAAAGVRYDSRDVPNNASSGTYLTLGGSFFPRAWDVTSPFGEAHASASTYINIPIWLNPVLGIQASGKKVWGQYPFDEAASIGGETTIRGAALARWAGDAAAWANVDLRVPIANFVTVLPGRLGVLGLVDAGRVFLTGESSDVWHIGFGGGLWYSLFDPINTLVFTVAHADNQTSVYFRIGFIF